MTVPGTPIEGSTDQDLLWRMNKAQQELADVQYFVFFELHDDVC